MGMMLVQSLLLYIAGDRTCKYVNTVSDSLTWGQGKLQGGASRWSTGVVAAVCPIAQPEAAKIQQAK